MKNVLILAMGLIMTPFFAHAQTENESIQINHWSQSIQIQIASEVRFSNNAERGSYGDYLPTGSFTIENGLQCFYNEGTTNLIRNSRPDWYMSCGPRPFHNERYVRNNPNCGHYDYSVHKKSVNCFSQAGTDQSKAELCYVAKGTGGWHRINCLNRD